jgi:hypothetical protein
MVNKKRGVGRPRKSIKELMKKRDAVKVELDALRDETPANERTDEQRQHIVNRASHLCKLNRRIETGRWE